MEPNINSEKSKFRYLIVVLVLLLVLAMGTTYYFYQKTKTNISENPEKQLSQVIKMVSRHMVLPTDETPTMATVSDPEKLKDQPFFMNAQKGDKVLIFSESRKAILYNPTSDKIIEVAPINTSNPTISQ